MIVIVFVFVSGLLNIARRVCIYLIESFTVCNDIAQE